MKKVIFSIVMMLVFAMGMQAQEMVPVFNKQNVSLSLNGGVQTNLYDWNTPQGAVASLGVNYQFTPIFGLTAEVGTGINNTRNWYYGTSHFHGTTFDQISVFVDARVNLMNAFGGYTGNARVFEIEPLVGVGYGHSFNEYISVKNVLLAKAGINFNFNINNNWAINITPAVIWNVRADGEKIMSEKYAVGQLTASVTYSFPSYYGGTTERLVYTQSEVDALNAEINALRAAHTVEVREVEVIVTKTDTVYVNVPDHTSTVAFTINSSKLPAYVPVLDTLAKQYNADNDCMYYVDGYASEDGSEAYNEGLSMRRAEAVKTYMVNAGVPADRIKVMGKGETTDFGNREHNRIVIVTYHK